MLFELWYNYYLPKISYNLAKKSSFLCLSLLDQYSFFWLHRSRVVWGLFVFIFQSWMVLDHFSALPSNIEPLDARCVALFTIHYHFVRKNGCRFISSPLSYAFLEKGGLGEFIICQGYKGIRQSTMIINKINPILDYNQWLKYLNT